MFVHLCIWSHVLNEKPVCGPTAPHNRVGKIGKLYDEVMAAKYQETPQPRSCRDYLQQCLEVLWTIQHVRSFLTLAYSGHGQAPSDSLAADTALEEQGGRWCTVDKT